MLYCAIDAAKTRIEPRKQSLFANSEQRRYNLFRSKGLMRCGVIESGCKQIVTQRLKLPGVQWLGESAPLCIFPSDNLCVHTKYNEYSTHTDAAAT